MHMQEEEECVDLYTTKILLPRAVILLLFIIGFILLVRFKYFSAEIRKDQQFKRSAGLFIICAVFWVGCISSWIQYEFVSVNPTSLDKPRFVLSFTTTTVEKIKPTLEGHLNQLGSAAYDQIYVVIPETFKGKKTVIPQWLIGDTKPLMNEKYAGFLYSVVPSPLHEKIRLIIISVDFGPASKLLGALLVEHDPATIMVYGDDDRMPSPHFASRAWYYAMKYPSDAISANGGWLGKEGLLYCGRALEVGVNRVSQLMGASYVVTRRKFYPDSVLNVQKYSKGCFLGDDFYLSYVLAVQGIRRRLVYDSCWVLPDQAYERVGLSGQKSTHAGGNNIAHYQECFDEVGDGISDSEFGRIPMFVFSRVWGVIRLIVNAYHGDDIVPC